MAPRANRQFFKKLYRKEPISSFLIMMGIMQVVIGGVDEQWNLFSLGLGLMLGAVVVRWSQIRKHKRSPAGAMSRRYLPPSESLQSLPKLVNEQQQR
ncbi:MAG: hypothetical protein WBB82_13210 [Limnothrix sp.]